MSEALTMTIVKILADGIARSNEELARMTGTTVAKVRWAINSLKKDGYAESEPVRYRITPMGEARAQWKHKWPERREYMAEYRKRKKAEREQGTASERITKHAIASRHPLAGVWA